MSLIPYLSIAILSIPNPKAKPEYLFVSMLQFSKTLGLTVPQPSISSHSSVPGKRISTSADGSVKGK